MTKHATLESVSINTLIELAVTRTQTRTALVGRNGVMRRAALSSIQYRIEQARVFNNPLRLSLTNGAEKLLLPNGSLIRLHSTSRASLRGCVYDLVAFDLARDDVPDELMEDAHLTTVTLGGGVGFLRWEP